MVDQRPAARRWTPWRPSRTPGKGVPTIIDYKNPVKTKRFKPCGNLHEEHVIRGGWRCRFYGGNQALSWRLRQRLLQHFAPQCLKAWLISYALSLFFVMLIFYFREPIEQLHRCMKWEAAPSPTEAESVCGSTTKICLCSFSLSLSLSLSLWEGVSAGSRPVPGRSLRRLIQRQAGIVVAPSSTLVALHTDHIVSLQKETHLSSKPTTRTRTHTPITTAQSSVQSKPIRIQSNPSRISQY